MSSPRVVGPSAYESFLEADGARLYVREIGQGWPIVILHGGPDFDHEYLLPDMDRLAASFRLVYYDQRGRGRSFSGEGPDDVSLASELEDIDRVRAWTGSSSVAVLGHSFGGLLAMEYAVHYPRAVSHLVLMNTAPASHADNLRFGRELAARRSPEQRARMTELRPTAREAGDIAADAEYHRIHFSAGLSRPGQLDLVIRQLRRGFTSEGIVAASRIEDRLVDQTLGLEGYDLLPRLRRLRVPTLVIHGETDVVPLDVVRRIAAAIPGARLAILPDCGHFAYLEQPDRVRALLDEFLPPATEVASSRGPRGT
jgi:proline iminopeptidase